MDLLFLSRRIFLGDGSQNSLIHGGIIVDTDGIIRRVLRSPQEVNTYLYNTESESVYDFGDLVLMPGLIDPNVHINEPGRKDWEGFVTATKAAAGGGFTTIIDRPTNATPPTVSVAGLKAKTATARGKIYVDVGFWGGLIPGNGDQLGPLLAAGVMGLQCTLCGSASPVSEEFPAVNEAQLEEALCRLEKDHDEGEAIIAVHAELPLTKEIPSDEEAPREYGAFLATRPPAMEISATQLLCRLAQRHPRRGIHILNASSGQCLQLVEAYQRQAGAAGSNLTLDTCPHYLALAAEDVPPCGTEFKTWPPIRERSNQEALWQALGVGGAIRMLGSDHSPATPGARALTCGRGRGNFLKAWPGINSLQLSLPVVWTAANRRGSVLTIADIHRLMCQEPAILCGLSASKGRIAEGYDADFCVWNPEEEFTVGPELLYTATKATPYAGQRLRGVVHATVVRGLHVYQQFEGFGQPLGKVLLRRSSRKLVKFVSV
ncbi:allantoinase isoform X2 [Drosophila elegans]|uniref:allantoinase isoform X2 n=2 Tax=Drosophila elegans TaxID=30023 RepID=UPI0007E73B61|nr:allantoinase isoform X2 [Drosophila elegans]